MAFVRSPVLASETIFYTGHHQTNCIRSLRASFTCFLWPFPGRIRGEEQGARDKADAPNA